MSLNILIGWTINYFKTKFIKKQPNRDEGSYQLSHIDDNLFAPKQTVPKKASVEAETSTLTNKGCF